MSLAQIGVESYPGPPDGPGESFDRTPPQDVLAEQSVLGGMMLSKDAIADVVEVLRGSDFYRPAHETIFDAVTDLYGKGEPADAVTVADELTKRGDLTRIGGAAYLHTLISGVPTAANAGYYAQIVRERAVLRRLVEAGTRIVQLGYATGGGDVDDLVNAAQSEVYAVTERRTSEDYLPIGQIIESTVDEIEAAGHRDGTMAGVPTGFTDLDALTHGLHPGQMIVIAARPAIGKCLAAGSLITDAHTGRTMPIEEFVARGRRGERLAVRTLDERWRLGVAEPSAYVCNGLREVLRLRLRSGRSLTATGNHPLRALTGWVPLEQLQRGDSIAVPRPGPDDCATGWGPGPAPYVDLPDSLPHEIVELVEKAKGEHPWGWVNRICGLPVGHSWALSTRQRLSRRQLTALAQASGDHDLLHLASSDVLWDEVIAVEPAGVARVFDLTIDGTHNFVADDIVVHNSTMGLDIARSASIKHNMTSVIFSLEMSRTEITMRMLSAEARIPLQKLRQGKLDDADWTKMARTMGELTDAPLFIDDSPNMSLMEIRAKCRRLKQRHDLRIVIIDYLQLMQSGKRVESRQQEVSEFSRALKLLAKELEVPVVAISQLNRGAEARTDKKPMMSDLRESGCLPADARILRADTGAETTMGELYALRAKDVPVWSLDDSLRYVRRHLTHVFPTGIKPVFRVQLASGKQVRATANHPFLTYDGWTPLEQLGAGSRVAVPRHVPAPGFVAAWDDAQVVTLAHLLGDGSFVKRQPLRYASIDEANLAAVTDAARFFGISAVRDNYPAARVTTLRLPAPYRLARGRRNPIAAWLDDFGLFGLRSHEKFVPEEVFHLPKRQIAMFLRHIWATDGSVTLNRTGRSGRVYYASTSRRLIDDLSRLLLRFGISTRVRETTPKADYRPGWSLDISGVDDQRRFLGEIGVHGQRGLAARALLHAVRDISANTNVDTVPAEIWDRVRSVLVEPGMSHREFAAAMGTQFCGSALWKHAPSRQRLGRVAALLDDAELDVMAVNDVLWDSIVSIEPDGVEEVYDATVIGNHNFVADGVAVHNSIEQDADMVILLHREDAYERESPRAGEADFIVAKHRNGPTDTITVAFQGHYSRFVDMAAT